MNNRKAPAVIYLEPTPVDDFFESRWSEDDIGAGTESPWHAYDVRMTVDEAREVLGVDVAAIRKKFDAAGVPWLTPEEHKAVAVLIESQSNAT